MNWKKLNSKLGAAERGSTSVAALVAVLALGGAGYYANNNSNRIKQSVTEAKVTATKALVFNENMNQASRFKALMANREMVVDGFTRIWPSIYAKDYFEPNWKLERNLKDPKQITDIVSSGAAISFGKSSGLVDNEQSRKANKDRLAKLDDLATYDKIFSNQIAAADLATPLRDFEFVGHKKGTTPLEIAAVYIRVKSRFANEAPTVVEVPVPKPPLENVRLQYSADGSNWSNVGNTPPQLSAGTYWVRLLADGVVRAGHLTVNGDEDRFGIDEKTGKPNHNAINVLAHDVVIRQKQFQITHTPASENPNTCAYTPEGSSGAVISYQVEGIGDPISGKIENKKEFTFALASSPSPKDIPFATAVNYCQSECAFYDEASFENGLSARWGATDYKGSYTQEKVMNEDRVKWQQMDKKLCINAKKAADAYNKYAGLGKLQFHYQLDTTDYRDYREMLTYDIPSCKEEFLFQRGKCGCFAEKTNILMGDGKTEKAIEDLASTDLVWNPILKKAMGIKRMTKGPENVAMLQIATGGKVLSVTGTHPFPTEKGTRAAFELEPNERILMENGEWSTIESITASNDALGKDVWNLELAAPDASLDNHYVVANGVITGDLLIQENLQKK